MNCERCFNETAVTTMSWLNEDVICLECDKKEKSHPRYKDAKDAEFEQVKQGNYNYKGLLS